MLIFSITRGLPEQRQCRQIPLRYRNNVSDRSQLPDDRFKDSTMNKLHTLFLILSGVFLIGGCSASTAEIADSADRFDFKLFEGSEEDDEVAAQEAASAEALLVPNPSRTNPFASNSEDSVSGNETVRLKGFVDVDKPQAVLRVNRKLIVLGEGEEQRGVKVWKVNPPSIVYEQGGTEHHLSL